MPAGKKYEAIHVKNADGVTRLMVLDEKRYRPGSAHFKRNRASA